MISIGNTSLIKLEQMTEPSCSEIFVKYEGGNPTGCMKDRIALSMIEGAERNEKSILEDSLLFFCGVICVLVKAIVDPLASSLWIPQCHSSRLFEGWPWILPVLHWLSSVHLVPWPHWHTRRTALPQVLAPWLAFLCVPCQKQQRHLSQMETIDSHLLPTAQQADLPNLLLCEPLHECMLSHLSKHLPMLTRKPCFSHQWSKLQCTWICTLALFAAFLRGLWFGWIHHWWQAGLSV